METKSTVTKRMRFGGIQRQSAKKSPFKSSHKPPYKSPIFRPRHTSTTHKWPSVNNKISTRQFDQNESEVREDFTVVSDSTLSVSDSEDDELPTELRNDDANDQQTETNIRKDIELIKTPMPKGNRNFI